MSFGFAEELAKSSGAGVKEAMSSPVAPGGTASPIRQDAPFVNTFNLVGSLLGFGNVGTNISKTTEAVWERQLKDLAANPGAFLSRLLGGVG